MESKISTLNKLNMFPLIKTAWGRWGGRRRWRYVQPRYVQRQPQRSNVSQGPRQPTSGSVPVVTVPVKPRIEPKRDVQQTNNTVRSVPAVVNRTGTSVTISPTQQIQKSLQGVVPRATPQQVRLDPERYLPESNKVRSPNGKATVYWANNSGTGSVDKGQMTTIARGLESVNKRAPYAHIPRVFFRNISDSPVVDDKLNEFIYKDIPGYTAYDNAGAFIVMDSRYKSLLGATLAHELGHVAQAYAGAKKWRNHIYDKDSNGNYKYPDRVAENEYASTAQGLANMDALGVIRKFPVARTLDGYDDVMASVDFRQYPGVYTDLYDPNFVNDPDNPLTDVESYAFVRPGQEYDRMRRGWNLAFNRAESDINNPETAQQHENMRQGLAHRLTAFDNRMHNEMKSTDVSNSNSLMMHAMYGKPLLNILYENMFRPLDPYDRQRMNVINHAQVTPDMEYKGEKGTVRNLMPMNHMEGLGKALDQIDKMQQNEDRMYNMGLSWGDRNA